MNKEWNYKQLDDIVEKYRGQSGAKIKRFTKQSQSYEGFFKTVASYYEDHSIIIIEDCKKACEESNFFLGSYNYLSINSMALNEQLFLLRLVELHVFFRFCKMKITHTEKIDKKHYIVNPRTSSEDMWYRGQTNSTWTLIPSFFRNHKKSCLHNWLSIRSDYDSKPSKKSLIKKLEKEIKINTLLEPYNTLAFIQHSIGYSPLIDFSMSEKVALSFALANGSSMVAYHGEDACVFELKLFENKPLTKIDEINKVIESFNVQVFLTNSSITTLLLNKMWIGLMTGRITSKIHLINKPTNDRMMFQKGTFILMDKVIIIGNEIYLSFGEAIDLAARITKYIIEPSKKEDIYEILMNDFPQYHYRYLMDPYLYITEPNI